ncbi:transposase [Yinghuangia sp. YIM S09857]|uniref:transposase n=1 Tax=Yinghuangia sp. YIM S09857 TaxID=3436929 RepID=UPI003F5344EC
MAIRDHFDGLWSDEDFAEWYPRDGRPGLSPAQLATVFVLQFLKELSDRQAAEAVRCRIDVKYALGMELDDPGFHHSVLSDFRERLSEEGRADRLLGPVLERLKGAGLIRERGRQRTDSTHILAATRDLTRLELVSEAMRAAFATPSPSAGLQNRSPAPKARPASDGRPISPTPPTCR